MSTAERTARQFYQAHHMISMPEDVQKQLIILMLSAHGTEEELEESKEILPPYKQEEVESRAMQAYREAKEGKVYPIDQLFTDMESKYPWLCD